MDWSALVSLVAVAVAGLSVWLSYRERTSAHRQFVYQKQADAYREMLHAFNPLTRKMFDLLPADAAALDAKLAAKIVNETQADYNAAMMIHNELVFMLDQQVSDKFVRALELWESLEAGEWSGKGNNPYAEWYDCMNGASNEARRAMGIVPLTREAQSVIGVVPRKPRKN